MIIAAGRQTVNTAIGASIEIIAPTTLPVQIRQLIFASADAVGGIFILGFPAAKGVTPTTPVSFLLQSGAGTPLTTHARAWGTPPTSPLNAYRIMTFGTTIGQSFTFDFPSGLIIPANGSLVLYANTICGAINCNMVAVEG